LTAQVQARTLNSKKTVLELNLYSFALQFANANGTVLPVFNRAGVPCPTEQIVAKLADLT
jgi:hypothetical protein